MSEPKKEESKGGGMSVGQKLALAGGIVIILWFLVSQGIIGSLGAQISSFLRGLFLALQQGWGMIMALVVVVGFIALVKGSKGGGEHKKDDHH